MGRVDGYNPQNTRKDGAFTWTDTHLKDLNSSVPQGDWKFQFFCLVPNYQIYLCLSASMKYCVAPLLLLILGRFFGSVSSISLVSL